MGKTKGKLFLSGAKLISMSGKIIENGAILVENGRIVQIGENAAAPADAEKIDLTGTTVTPGLVDAHCHIGSAPEGFPMGMEDTNDMVDPVAPQLRILDAVYPDDTAFGDALAGGVTCVQTLPGSGNVIGGQGVIVKTKPDVTERMIVREPSSLKGALGENPVRIYSAKSKLPNTRMGSAALMRDAFTKAGNYRAKKAAAAANKTPFDVDLGMETLLSVLEKALPFHVHCHRSDDIQTAVRIAEEFGLVYTIEHCTEGHLIAPWLAQKNVRAAVGPTLTAKSKLELRNKTWDTPRLLWEAGVHFCIITDHPVIPIEHLIVCAALANRAGLPAEEALKAVTIYAAEHIGVADRVGTLEAGKDADIAVWDGDPLDARSKVVRTFVGGELVFCR